MPGLLASAAAWGGTSSRLLLGALGTASRRLPQAFQRGAAPQQYAALALKPCELSTLPAVLAGGAMVAMCLVLSWFESLPSFGGRRVLCEDATAMLDDKLARLFALFDRDKDGVLSRAEFEELVAATNPGRQMDAEVDWILSRCALKLGGRPEAGLTREHLKRCYYTGHGAISKDFDLLFKQGMKGQQEPKRAATSEVATPDGQDRLRLPGQETSNSVIGTNAGLLMLGVGVLVAGLVACLPGKKREGKQDGAATGPSDGQPPAVSTALLEQAPGDLGQTPPWLQYADASVVAAPAQPGQPPWMKYTDGSEESPPMWLKDT